MRTLNQTHFLPEIARLLWMAIEAVVFVALLYLLSLLCAPVAYAAAETSKPTVVLVHGAFADSSSWNGVITKLLAKGLSRRRSRQSVGRRANRRRVHGRGHRIDPEKLCAGMPFLRKERHHERLQRQGQHQGARLRLGPCSGVRRKRSTLAGKAPGSTLGPTLSPR